MAVAMLVTFSFKDVRRTKNEFDYIKHFKSGISYIKSKRKIRYYIVIGSIYISVYWTSYQLFQPIFVKIGVPLYVFGSIFAVFYIITSIGSKLSHAIECRFGEDRIIYAILILSMLGYASIGLGIGFTAILICVLLSFCYGLIDPITLIASISM